MTLYQITNDETWIPEIGSTYNIDEMSNEELGDTIFRLMAEGKTNNLIITYKDNLKGDK